MVEGLGYCRVESLFEDLHCKDRRTAVKILSELDIPIIHKAGKQWVSKASFNNAFIQDHQDFTSSEDNITFTSKLTEFDSSGSKKI